jgi:glycerol-3-phosphate dehydrogenase
VARLIAEFHGGTIAATNLTAGDGVALGVRISPRMEMIHDLLVIGGGINGCRHRARTRPDGGLSVVLVERGDLAAATSSASSKLIHGGLRYLEHYEFRLVAEALAEREILLRVAGHLTWPTRFVMPHVPELRPRWMIRVGLFLYDHLDAALASCRGRTRCGSTVRAYGAGLRAELKHGFRVLRLPRGRRPTRSGSMRSTRRGAAPASWWGASAFPPGATAATGSCSFPAEKTVRARAIVNAAGPWVKQALNQRLGESTRDSVRLVKGSHIVLPSLYPGGMPFILQNDDRRVVFMIPYEDRFTLVGTNRRRFQVRRRRSRASEAESSNTFAAPPAVTSHAPPSPAEVLWRYAGVRPLYDDGSEDPSAITRDYTLRVRRRRGPGAGVVGLRRQDHDPIAASPSTRWRSSRRTFRR